MTSMGKYALSFRLASDTVFGTASRTSVTADIEVHYDRWGCPYYPGKALKGVLREECANILFALSKTNKDKSWQAPAERLFGKPGIHSNDTIMVIRDAMLPEATRGAIIKAVEDGKKITPREVLNAFTAIRKQTRIDPLSGAAAEKSLRAMRVVIRDAMFEAGVQFVCDPEPADLQLLCACAKGLRRIGVARNRGPGKLMEIDLKDTIGASLISTRFSDFKNAVLAQGEAAP